MAIQFTFVGNKDLARQFVRRARKEMGALKNALSYQNLFQGRRRVLIQTNPEVFVVCAIAGSVELATIVAESVGGAPTYKWTYNCFCAPCFSMGVVGTKTIEDPTDTEYREGIKYVYNVEVCIGRGIYIPQVAAADGWAEYYEGQFVLVGVDTDPSTWSTVAIPNCCSRERCLFEADDSIVTNLYIYPLHLIGAMNKKYPWKKRTVWQ